MSTKTPSDTPSGSTGRSLDQIDLEILAALRDDSRISMTELAESVNISRANAHARVSRLSQEQVIRRFTIDVDPARVGLPTAALIAVKMDFHEWRNIWREVEKIPEVAYQALTTGDHDFLLVIRASSVETIRDVILDRLNSIPGIQSTTTALLLDESGPRVILGSP